MDGVVPSKPRAPLADALAKRQKAGFALVDALTALAILATTLSLALGVAKSSRKVATQAAETRTAQVVLQFLNERHLPTLGTYDGELPGAHWRIALTEFRRSRIRNAVPVCQRTTMVTTRSGRHFNAYTMEPCPLPVDAP